MPLTVNKANNLPIVEVPKALQKADILPSISDAIIDHTSGALEYTGKVTGQAKQAIGGMAITAGAIGVVFTLPSLVSNITKAIASSSLVERVKSVFQSVADTSSLWFATSALLSGLKNFGVLAASAISWTPIVNAIMFPFQAIGVGLQAHTIHEVKKERTEILKKINVKDLTKALQYVQKNGETLRKSLVFSKATEINKKAEELLKRIRQENDKQAKADAEKFMHILKRRIHTKHNLAVANLVSKVASLAGMGLLVFGTPNPVTLAISGTIALGSLTLYATEKLLMNKDPFSQPKDVWYAKLAHKMREAFGSLTDKIAAKAT